MRWRSPFSQTLFRRVKHSPCLTLWPTELTVPAPGHRPPLFLAGLALLLIPATSCQVGSQAVQPWHIAYPLCTGISFVRGEGKRKGCTREWSVMFFYPLPHLFTFLPELWMDLDKASPELRGHSAGGQVRGPQSLLCPCAHFTDEMGAGSLERQMGLRRVPSQQLEAPGEQ